MYIIVGDENISSIDENYLILELDTFKTDKKLVPTFCVVDFNNLNIDKLTNSNSHKELHDNLIKNYKLGNWDFCIAAVKYLIGKFNGELDSFYVTLVTRINELKIQDTIPNWDGSITPVNGRIV
jgi:hypothetical protein